ncbi:MAG TPA: hypothetical protein DEQ40_13675 [Oxalobacteraceae bacterium]|jgi:hypothetical protein|nr:hypothetical protein [Oxalobacteraceae bacterium]
MIGRPSRIAALVAIGWLLLASAEAAQTCHYVVLDPRAGKVSAGKLTIDLGQGDDAMAPRSWQGPIAIAQSGGTSCTVDSDVSILERPIYLDGKSHLLVTTYSGSNRVVFAIDATTCRVLWRSKPFVGSVRLKAGVLQTGKQRTKFGSHCTP